MQKRPPSKLVERLVILWRSWERTAPIQNVANRLDGLNESDVKRGVGVAPIDTARDDECEI